MRMEFISIGDIVRDNSCAYSCIDRVVGVQYNKNGTLYKMCSSGLYVPSDKVEKVICTDD